MEIFRFRMQWNDVQFNYIHKLQIIKQWQCNNSFDREDQPTVCSMHGNYRLPSWYFFCFCWNHIPDVKCNLIIKNYIQLFGKKQLVGETMRICIIQEHGHKEMELVPLIYLDFQSMLCTGHQEEGDGDGGKSVMKMLLLLLQQCRHHHHSVTYPSLLRAKVPDCSDSVVWCQSMFLKLF